MNLKIHSRIKKKKTVYWKVNKILQIDANIKHLFMIKTLHGVCEDEFYTSTSK